MNEYGTEKTEHIGICYECKETTTVRTFLTFEKKEVNVCLDCYMKN